jgi:transcriptional regulator with XRE-family HTH domain
MSEQVTGWTGPQRRILAAKQAQATATGAFEQTIRDEVRKGRSVDGEARKGLSVLAAASALAGDPDRTWPARDRVQQILATPAAPATEPPAAVTVFMRGAGVKAQEWEQVQSGMWSRGWRTVRDRAQAWHLARARVGPVALVDITARDDEAVIVALVRALDGGDPGHRALPITLGGPIPARQAGASLDTTMIARRIRTLIDVDQHTRVGPWYADLVTETAAKKHVDGVELADRTSIADIEAITTGRRVPTTAELLAIADALDVTYDDLTDHVERDHRGRDPKAAPDPGGLRAVDQHGRIHAYAGPGPSGQGECTCGWQPLDTLPIHSGPRYAVLSHIVAVCDLDPDAPDIIAIAHTLIEPNA